jgi:predicted dehydrogenase
MRFGSVYRSMKAIVASGEIGEVAQMGAQKSYRLGERAEWVRHRSTYGGTIPYIGVHMVDLMRFTSGRELVEAAAYHSRVGYPELGYMQNTTSTIFRLDNGGTAALRMDYLRPAAAPTHGDDRLRLAGTKGVLEYQRDTGLTLVTGGKKPHVITDLPPGRSLFVDFLESLYLGKPVGLSHEDIFRVSEIVVAAHESAERGQFVKT